MDISKITADIPCGHNTLQQVASGPPLIRLISSIGSEIPADEADKG